MHVLVTGDSGFIGCHVTRALLARGDTVTGVDRRPTAEPDAPCYTQLRADLTTSDCWQSAARRADAVVHLAARPGVRGGATERDRARDILGSAEAVLAATPRRTPVVMVSSSAVYGEAPTTRGSRESDALRPLGAYGRWKLAVEVRCAARAAAGGLVSIARPFSVAGPGQRPDMAIARWLAAVSAGRAVTVYGNPTNSRDVTAVADITVGLLALVDLGVRQGRSATVNLGAGRPRTHLEVLDAVARVIGREADVTPVAPHPDDVGHTWADPTLAVDLLGWRPGHDLDALLQQQLSPRASLVSA